MSTTKSFRISSVCGAPGCCWPADWKVLLNDPWDDSLGRDCHRLVFQTPDQVGGFYAWEVLYTQALFVEHGGEVTAHMVRAVPAVEWVKVDGAARPSN